MQLFVRKEIPTELGFDELVPYLGPWYQSLPQKIKGLLKDVYESHTFSIEKLDTASPTLMKRIKLDLKGFFRWDYDMEDIFVDKRLFTAFFTSFLLFSVALIGVKNLIYSAYRTDVLKEGEGLDDTVTIGFLVVFLIFRALMRLGGHKKAHLLLSLVTYIYTFLPLLQLALHSNNGKPDWAKNFALVVPNDQSDVDGYFLTNLGDIRDKGGNLLDINHLQKYIELEFLQADAEPDITVYTPVTPDGREVYVIPFQRIGGVLTSFELEFLNEDGSIGLVPKEDYKIIQFEGTNVYGFKLLSGNYHLLVTRAGYTVVSENEFTIPQETSAADNFTVEESKQIITKLLGEKSVDDTLDVMNEILQMAAAVSQDPSVAGYELGGRMDIDLLKSVDALPMRLFCDNASVILQQIVEVANDLAPEGTNPIKALMVQGAVLSGTPVGDSRIIEQADLHAFNIVGNEQQGYGLLDITPSTFANNLNQATLDLIDYLSKRDIAAQNNEVSFTDYSALDMFGEVKYKLAGEPDVLMAVVVDLGIDSIFTPETRDTIVSLFALLVTASILYKSRKTVGRFLWNTSSVLLISLVDTANFMRVRVSSSDVGYKNNKMKCLIAALSALKIEQPDANPFAVPIFDESNPERIDFLSPEVHYMQVLSAAALSPGFLSSLEDSSDNDLRAYLARINEQVEKVTGIVDKVELDEFRAYIKSLKVLAALT